jgi:hypothetical protein
VSREKVPHPGEQNGAVVRVTAADVVPSANLRTPTAQTFEELGIPPSFREAVEKELTRDEKMVWLGRPSRNRQVHPRNTILSIIGLGLIALGLGVAFISLGAGGGLFPCVFGGALAAIGCAFLLPLVIDPTKSCRSCYVVTNRRAILVEVSVWALGRPKAKTYLPHELLGLERRNHPEAAGAGDLIFEYYFAMSGRSIDPNSGFMHQQGSTGVGLNNTTPNRIPRGFFLLDQVGEVEHLIRTTLLEQLEQALDEPEQSSGAGGVPEPDAEAVSFTCACGVTVEAPGSLAGRWVKCPRCSVAVSIPRPVVGAGAAAGHEPCREDGPIAADVKAKTLAELDPTEKVIWLGRPVPRLVFVRSSGWLVGGAVGTLIALVWLINALLPAKAADAAAAQKALAAQQAGKAATAAAKAAAPNLWLPGGLLLVSTCCAVVPLVRWHFARRTCYALTNRRALVYKEGLFGPIRESYPPLEVANMRQSNSWLFSGSGDLIFRTVTVITTSRNRNGTSSSSVRTVHYGFLAIAQVQDVGRLVRETLIDRLVDKLNRAGCLR